MIFIGDIHGNYLTFLELLKQLPQGEKIYLTGDLIDRGRRSKEMVDYLIQHPEIKSVLGNHELMLLAVLEGVLKESSWMKQGGLQTILSYGGQEIQGIYGGTIYNYTIPDNHIQYFQSLPDVIEGDNWILSHSGDIKDCQSRKIVHADKFHIFGHNPFSQALIMPHFAGIDTGCFYKNVPGYGNLTALQYPSMKLFTQKNID